MNGKRETIHPLRFARPTCLRGTVCYNCNNAITHFLSRESTPNQRSTPKGAEVKVRGPPSFGLVVKEVEKQCDNGI